MYKIRQDEHGYINGIERDGYTILRFVSEPSEREVREIVRLLNTTETEEGLVQRLRDENEQLKAEIEKLRTIQRALVNRGEII